MKYWEITFELKDIASVAGRFVSQMGDKKIFTFSGELGAGKTTFIAALCRELGVTEVVSSPTFAIIQQYSSPNRGTIYHLDLYRIRDEEEAIQSGLEDCLLSGALCMVEWPENAPGIFGGDAVHTDVAIIDSARRKLLVHLPE